jgi:hypothetical protein
MIDLARRIEAAELLQTFQQAAPFFARGAAGATAALDTHCWRTSVERYRQAVPRRPDQRDLCALGRQQTFVGSPGDRERVARRPLATEARCRCSSWTP